MERRYKWSARFDPPPPEPVLFVVLEQQHDVDAEALPKRDRSLHANAKLAGMLGRVTGARTLHPAKSKLGWNEPRLVDSVVMRVVSPDRQLRGWIAWENGSFSEAWLWHAGDVARRATRNAFAEVLRDRATSAKAYEVGAKRSRAR